MEAGFLSGEASGDSSFYGPMDNPDTALPKKMAEEAPGVKTISGGGQYSDLKYLSRLELGSCWFAIDIDNQESLHNNCTRDHDAAQAMTRRLFDPLRERYVPFKRFPNILIGYKFVDGAYVARANVPDGMKNGDVVVTCTRQKDGSTGHMCVTVVDDGYVDMFDPNGPNDRLEVWKKAVAAAAGLKYKTQAESRFRQKPQALINEDYIKGSIEGDPWATIAARENNGMCQIISAVKIWSIVKDGDKMESMADKDSINAYYNQVRKFKINKIFGDRESVNLSGFDDIQEWMVELSMMLGLPLEEGRIFAIRGPLVSTAPESTDSLEPTLVEFCTIYPESRYGPTNAYRASACITSSMHKALYTFMNDGVEEAVAVLSEIQLLQNRNHTLPIICLEGDNLIRTPVVQDLFPLPTSFHLRLVQVVEHIIEQENLEESIEELMDRLRTTIIQQYNNEALENPVAEGKTRYTDTRVAQLFARF
jgi:hypothetical protein